MIERNELGKRLRETVEMTERVERYSEKKPGDLAVQKVLKMMNP